MDLLILVLWIFQCFTTNQSVADMFVLFEKSSSFQNNRCSVLFGEKNLRCQRSVMKQGNLLVTSWKACFKLIYNNFGFHSALRNRVKKLAQLSNGLKTGGGGGGGGGVGICNIWSCDFRGFLSLTLKLEPSATSRDGNRLGNICLGKNCGNDEWFWLFFWT